MELALWHTYLHDADNQADYMRFFTTGRSDRPAAPGSGVRAYTAGRRRIVTTTDRSRTLAVTLRLVSDAQRLRLEEEWLTRPLLYRDPWARMFFGAYFDLAVTEYKDRSGFDVAVTLQRVTWPAGT